MAENVIKPLITKFLSVEKEEIMDKNEYDNECEYCENVFKTKRGLQGHITKKHREDRITTRNLTMSLSGDTDIILIEKEIDDETSLEEGLEINEEKKYTSKCERCEQPFQTFRKYELIQQLKKHKATCTSPLKYKQKSCQGCDFTTCDEKRLERHKRDKHDLFSTLTSPPPKKSKIDMKQLQEEMDIDDKDELKMEVDTIEHETITRSRMMDAKIEAKTRKMEEEERKYRERKLEELERTKKKEELEQEKRKLFNKQKKQKVKDQKKKGRKKNEIRSGEFQNIPNIKPVPKNIASLCNKGDLVYCVPGDGACGPNSISAHLFKDEVFGPKLRRKINDFKVRHWHRKYKLKTQCTIDSPFV